VRGDGYTDRAEHANTMLRVRSRALLAVEKAPAATRRRVKYEYDAEDEVGLFISTHTRRTRVEALNPCVTWGPSKRALWAVEKAPCRAKYGLHAGAIVHYSNSLCDKIQVNSYSLEM
jgi:hypothetical protein